MKSLIHTVRQYHNKTTSLFSKLNENDQKAKTNGEISGKNNKFWIGSIHLID